MTRRVGLKFGTWCVIHFQRTDGSRRPLPQEIFGLLHPVVAFGAVFEGEEFAEGLDIFIGPFSDLLEGADAVGVAVPPVAP